MNIVEIMTCVTLITVIAAYVSMCGFFELSFTKKKSFVIAEKMLWICTLIAWIADIIVLKGYFTSGITVVIQFVIQIGINVFWTMVLLATTCVLVKIKS